MNATRRTRKTGWARGFTYTVCWLAGVFSGPAFAAHVAGDVNESGIVSAADAQLVVNASNGASVEGNADIDYSGSVDAVDILLTLDAALGITIDRDGDGLADLAEVHLGTNPDTADTDGDTLTDYDEVVVYHTDPQIPNPAVQSFGINGLSILTASRGVKLNMVCLGSPTEYRADEASVSDADPWLTYSNAPDFTLSAGVGSKTVYVQVRDVYGMMSPVVSDSIVLDDAVLPTETHTYLLPGSVPLDMVWIPSGTFSMGVVGVSEPVHLVELTKGFWIGRYEVTQGQWQAVMGTTPSHFRGKPQCPVESVSWLDCQAFVTQLDTLGLGTFGLPTEAQWEYACRAGTTTKYSFGDDVGLLGTYGWYNANSGGRTRDVCTKLPNGYGIFDIHGNVWEWIQDHYGPYPSTAQRDPLGATTGLYAVVRGGCWANEVDYCASAFRDGTLIGAQYRYDNIGLRLVRRQDAGIPPSVTNFALNNGASETTSRNVTLNNACSGAPTYYKVSESAYFEGAEWQVYGTAPTFELSFGNEMKIVYFKVKDASDRESSSVGDSIDLNEAVPQEIMIALPNSQAMKLTWIPRGVFTMGQNGVAGSVHDVTLSHGFFLGTWEVTQAQWSAVMGANPSQFSDDPQRPVEHVSWDDCQAFLDELNKLGQGVFEFPTEAQWEYACRADTATAYSFGDAQADLATHGWYDANSPGKTAPVGGKLANPWGLYDVHGNVWELVMDFWADGYAPDAVLDPSGPVTGTARVMRGGAWNFDAAACRSAYRYDVSQDGRYSNVGLRVCRRPE